MPRYSFYIRWGQATILDRQGGVELANIEEALEEAVRRGRDMATPDIRKGIAPRGGVFIIDDELGTVRELSFKEISKTLCEWRNQSERPDARYLPPLQPIGADERPSAKPIRNPVVLGLVFSLDGDAAA